MVQSQSICALKQPHSATVADPVVLRIRPSSARANKATRRKTLVISDDIERAALRATERMLIKAFRSDLRALSASFYAQTADKHSMFTRPFCRELARDVLIAREWGSRRAVLGHEVAEIA